KIGNHLFNCWRARKLIKHWIEIVQRMADLVNRPLFTLPQCSVRQECILFKEETDLVTRFQEIVIAGAVLFVCGEDRDDAPRMKVTNKFFCSRAQTIAGLRFNKVFEYQETVAFVTGELFWVHWRSFLDFARFSVNREAVV